MSVVKKAVTGVGLSLAIGAGGYAADKAFETPPEVVHEMYMDCLRLDNDPARVDCINKVTDQLTWPGLLQLAGAVGLVGSGYLFYRCVADELRNPPASPPPPTPSV